MGTELITSDVTGPFLADHGDIIRVLEGVTVDGSETQGIVARTSSDTGFRVEVLGTVLGDYYGVNLAGQSEGVGDNTLFISLTGWVTGTAAIYAGDGSGNRVVNEGLIDGQFGIVGDGAETVIANRGTIRTEMAALTLAGESSIVRNNGLIDGGLYFGASADSYLLNTGTITTNQGGIVVADCAGFQLLNRGNIQDQNASNYALHLNSVTGFQLVNEGTLASAYCGLDMLNSEGRLANIGTLSGADFGVRIQGNSETAVVIHNSGLISGDVAAIIGSDAPVRISNSGTFDGSVQLTGDARDDRLGNGGDIIGNVHLGAGDDVFVAHANGEVTGSVKGEDGDDRLTGAANPDRLSGGSGADYLSGRRGNDWLHGGGGTDSLFGGWGRDHLDGGSGSDLLSGDGGNDVLTGRQGNDIFVFGTGAGEDRVTDFLQGTDILRLSGHSGGFASLAIADRNAQLEIIHDGGTILLDGLAGATLTAGDFEFL